VWDEDLARSTGAVLHEVRTQVVAAQAGELDGAETVGVEDVDVDVQEVSGLRFEDVPVVVHFVVGGVPLVDRAFDRERDLVHGVRIEGEGVIGLFFLDRRAGVRIVARIEDRRAGVAGVPDAITVRIGLSAVVRVRAVVVGVEHEVAVAIVGWEPGVHLHVARVDVDEVHAVGGVDRVRGHGVRYAGVRYTRVGNAGILGTGVDPHVARDVGRVDGGIFLLATAIVAGGEHDRHSECDQHGRRATDQTG